MNNWEIELAELDKKIEEVKAIIASYGEKISLIERSDGKWYMRVRSGGKWHTHYIKKADRAKIREVMLKVRLLPALEHKKAELEILYRCIYWVQESLAMDYQ